MDGALGRLPIDLPIPIVLCSLPTATPSQRARTIIMHAAAQ
jgi:hypothetical protein